MTIAQDVRWAARSLRRQPGFTLVAVLTLALGIGANVTIFSIIDSVLLRALPYDEPDRLIRIYDTYPAFGVTSGNVSPIDVLDWRDQATALDGIAMGTGTFMGLSGDGDPAMVWVNATSANTFDVLGVQPALGRFFRSDEEVIGQQTENQRIEIIR